MRKPWVNLILFVALLGLSASFILITAFAQANSISTADSEIPNRSVSPEALPLRFPIGDWPWYAQGEIYLNPEPPMPGSPAEICVKVANDDPLFPHIATLQFGVAPLGIGVPYNPVGSVELEVPASGVAMGCTMWVSPEPGLWGIEVLLFQEDAQEPLRSLRNIDLWEPLVPGETHDLVFPVGPLGAEGILTFELIPHVSGWEFEIMPAVITPPRSTVSRLPRTWITDDGCEFMQKPNLPADIAVYGAAAGDANFVGGGDLVTYQVDVQGATGPFTLSAELLYEPLSYRFIQDLFLDKTPLTERFRGYYAEADKTPLVVAAIEAAKTK